MKDYNVHIDGDDGGETTVSAVDIEGAWDLAETWARGGDWDSALDEDGGVTIEVSVWDAAHDLYYDAVDAGAEYRSDYITIVAEEPECDQSEDGEHKWVGMGGCDENPGVFDDGAGAIEAYARCELCGLQRHEMALYAESNRRPDMPDRSATYQSS